MRTKSKEPKEKKQRDRNGANAVKESRRAALAFSGDMKYWTPKLKGKRPSLF